jgi:hypothetical protein
MADRTQKLAIVVTAQDLASGKLGLVRKELAAMGTAGKLSAIGLGAGIVAVNKTEKAFGHLKNRISSLAGPLGLIGITGAMFGLAGAFEQGISKVEGMALGVEKLTGVTGLSVHAASQLLAVFERFGVDADRAATIAGFAEKTLGKLAVGVGDLSTGVTKLTKLETLYGISLHDSTGKTVDFGTELNRVADYYAGNASAAQKAALAATLFGKGYVALIPVLKLGSKGIAEVAAAADNLGLTLKTAQDVQNVHDFINAQRDAKEAVGGLEVQLGLLVMPDLTGALKGFTGFLATHQADVKAFFSAALHGAEGFAGFITGSVVPAISDLAGAAMGFWDSIPPPLRDFLFKGIVADRMIHFLFGVSPIHMIVDVGEKALGQALGGTLGGFFQRGSPVNPMFVKNVGLPGIDGALGTGEKGLGLLSSIGLTIPVLAGVTLGVIAAAGLSVLLSDAINAKGGLGADITHPNPNVPPFAPVVRDSGVTGPIFTGGKGGGMVIAPPIGTNLNAAGQNLGTASNPLVATLLDRGGREPGKTDTFGPVRDAIESAKIAGVSATSLVTAAIHQEESAFHRDFAALRAADTPKAIAAAAKAIAADIAKGAGNAKNTNAVLATLRAKLDATHDPKTAAILRAAIRQVEAKVPGREWIQRQLDKADKVIRSSESTKQKVADLQVIERSLRARGDIHAANEIAKLIAINNSVKLVRNAIGGILFGGNAPGKNQDNTYHPPSGGGSPSGGGTSGSAKKRADGGMGYPGVTYRIGERGEEYFRPSVPGQIVPHHEAAGLMAAGTARAVMVAISLAVHITPRVNVSPRDIQNRTKSELRYGKLAVG